VVCLSVTRLRCLKTAESMDVLSGVETLGAQVTLYQVGVPVPLLRWGGKWGKCYPLYHMINTAVPTHSHSPDGATFYAAIAVLLQPLVTSSFMLALESKSYMFYISSLYILICIKIYFVHFSLSMLECRYCCWCVSVSVCCGDRILALSCLL